MWKSPLLLILGANHEPDIPHYIAAARLSTIRRVDTCAFSIIYENPTFGCGWQFSTAADALRKHPERESIYNLARMTEHIKRKLQDEINALEHELVHELPKEIKKAAALGDLSENAEYHMAKQRQEYVKARVRQLGKRLADLSMVNMNNIPKDRVGLGSTVKVFDNTKNEEIEYNIVTSEESDVAVGRISTTSPIGRALLNKKVGDTAVVVTPNGNRELEILTLVTIHGEVTTE
jgi:transcription elongation factor GreA